MVAMCPDCGAPSTFESRERPGTIHGRIINERPYYDPRGLMYPHVTYQLLRCATCGRGGLSAVAGGGGKDELLIAFSPLSAEAAPVPANTPTEIKAGLSEAERCAAVGAWRAASAMLRSGLEKTLKANGYIDGSLKDKIDEAAVDGVITAARRQRAHDEVRVLGNDVLHDAWRAVDETEYDLAHFYTQRVIEDF